MPEALPTAYEREPGRNALNNGHRLTLLGVSLLLGVLCFVYRYLAYRGFTNDHYVHLARRYEPVYRAEAGNRLGPLVVFAERNRPVEAIYEPLGTPCFRRPNPVTGS